jgi:levansucrase
MTTAWTDTDVGRIAGQSIDRAPILGAPATTKILPGLDLWDMWPVREGDGSIALLDGVEHWMALSAPADGPPGSRHDIARIRLIARRGETWTDLGNLFPEGDSVGSREWAGSAVLDRGASAMNVYYTAAGRRGESSPTFIQRIVLARAQWPSVSWERLSWEPHLLALEPAEPYQSTLGQVSGEPGFIKAFRDPFVFIDPADDSDHLLFTGSLVDSSTEFDGVIGLASRGPSGEFHPDPPLITADGVNNELERPHVVLTDGLYYLFFSTQARTFHPATPGPTGLYGFVGSSLTGDWAPLNGSGLVMANPIEEPHQAYSWLVLKDLRVTSFIDFHSLHGLHPDEIEATGLSRAHFGGTPAPVFTLDLDGDTARAR